jgi:uncharacterized protein (TIGR00369 family)
MVPSNPSFDQEIRRSFGQQAVMNLIGAELSRVEAGLVEITLPFRSDLTQQNGYLHAGIVTTIVDSACGYAAYTLMPEGADVLSVEFKMNMVRPARGQKFVARAEVIKPGRTLTVARGDVFGVDEAGKEELIATMLATLICLPR